VSFDLPLLTRRAPVLQQHSMSGHPGEPQAEQQQQQRWEAAAAASAAAAAGAGPTDPPLIKAVKRRQLEEVQRVLAADPKSAGETNKSGNTALHHAAAAGWEPAVRLLLAANPSAALQRNHRGSLPLHCAARQRSTAVVELLLNAAPEAATTKNGYIYGNTPLHVAASSGLSAHVALLLSAAPEAAVMRDAWGRTPLHTAVAEGKEYCASLLLTAAPQAVWIRSLSSDTPLHAAAEAGRPACVRLLLQAGGVQAAMAVNDSGETPLHIAACQDPSGEGRMEVVELLLAAAPAAAIAADRYGCTALHNALAQADTWRSKHGGGLAMQLLLLHRLLQTAPEALLVPEVYDDDPEEWMEEHVDSIANSRMRSAVLLLLNAAHTAGPAYAKAGSRPLLQAASKLPRQYTKTSAVKASKVVQERSGGAIVATTTTSQVTTTVTASPCFADLAARLALTPEEWALVPGPDPCLARALPAVLARSTKEAGLLVARLPQVRVLRATKASWASCPVALNFNVWAMRLLLCAVRQPSGAGIRLLVSMRGRYEWVAVCSPPPLLPSAHLQALHDRLRTAALALSRQRPGVASLPAPELVRQVLAYMLLD